MKGFFNIWAAALAISLISFSAANSVFAEDFSSVSENVSASTVSDEENSSQLNFSYEISEMENGGLSLSINVIDASDPNQSIDQKPWLDTADQIKEIFIRGVSSIPDDTFKECTGLSQITIFDSVKEIGENAFGLDANGEKIEDLIVICQKNSRAYEYAQNHGFETVIMSADGDILTPWEIRAEEGINNIPNEAAYPDYAAASASRAATSYVYETNVISTEVVTQVNSDVSSEKSQSGDTGSAPAGIALCGISLVLIALTAKKR